MVNFRYREGSHQKKICPEAPKILNTPRLEIEVDLHWSRLHGRHTN